LEINSIKEKTEMALERLMFETIDGGEALRQANRLLDRAVADVIARASINKARKVTLTISVNSLPDPVGGYYPEVQFSTGSTLPGVQSAKLVGQVRNGAIMLPNEDRPVQARFEIDGVEVEE
jgi:hypothetical protein